MALGIFILASGVAFTAAGMALLQGLSFWMAVGIFYAAGFSTVFLLVAWMAGPPRLRLRIPVMRRAAGPRAQALRTARQMS